MYGIALHQTQQCRHFIRRHSAESPVLFRPDFISGASGSSGGRRKSVRRSLSSLKLGELGRQILFLRINFHNNFFSLSLSLHFSLFSFLSPFLKIKVFISVNSFDVLFLPHSACFNLFFLISLLYFYFILSLYIFLTFNICATSSSFQFFDIAYIYLTVRNVAFLSLLQCTSTGYK